MDQLTIDLVGAVDHSVCSMCVPDQIHSILFAVESPLRSAMDHITVTGGENNMRLNHCVTFNNLVDELKLLFFLSDI